MLASNMAASIADNGHVLAMLASASSLTPAARYAELFNGMTQVNTVVFRAKHPLPYTACTAFQGVNAAASIQTYANCIQGKCPCGPKSRVMFKCPWGHYGTRKLYSESIILCSNQVSGMRYII
jgi:hypothetical protein